MVHVLDESSSAIGYTDAPTRVTVALMAVDRTRTLRGALAGATAAAVWAAQQPLDQRVFGCPYDDVELLGRLVTSGRAAYPVGLAMHLLNGAVFGAAYANARRVLPLPAVLRGPAAGLAEHLATWPATAALARLDGLPDLWGSGRAFAQATWRHVLFGVLLGEVERRLNPPASEAAPAEEDIGASNGHGNVEHMVTAQHL